MQNLLRSQRGKAIGYFAIFLFLSITIKAIIKQQLNTERIIHNPRLPLSPVSGKSMCYNVSLSEFPDFPEQLPNYQSS